MMPCSPETTFCSIVGQASRHTARLIGPSMMERSNFCVVVLGDDPDRGSTAVLINKVQSISLLSEQRHRINSNSASPMDIAHQHRDRQNAEREHDIGERISGTHLKEHV